MPTDRTVVTELATALGTLPHGDLAAALAARPHEVRIVPAIWDRLDALYAGGKFAQDFAVAYANGRAFAAAPDGLRGRAPCIIEWTGGRRPPGDEVAPIDLRIDHVFMVSAKYLSRNLSNPSPARLFDGLLATMGGWERGDWYLAVAPAQYQRLYDRSVEVAGIGGMPETAARLTGEDRKRLHAALERCEPDERVEAAYDALCETVSAVSVEIWREGLATFDHGLMLWRLLRIGNAPYYLLGSHGTESLRLRIATAWDWRDTYELRDLSVEAVRAGQPKVEWVARYRVRDTRETRTVRGHVEIRWSHGRFAQPPEAKIYIDTPIEQVPGYHQLGGDPERLFDP